MSFNALSENFADWFTICVEVDLLWIVIKYKKVIFRISCAGIEQVKLICICICISVQASPHNTCFLKAKHAPTNVKSETF
jgi:hypothetical protein